MIYSFFICFFTLNILPVRGFFYQALPLMVIKTQDKYKAFCPWNDSRDPNLRCMYLHNIMGYCHKDTRPKAHDFLSPTVQTLFTEDQCKKFKENYESQQKLVGMCKDYSSCFNLSNTKSMCTCNAGFFGDPYVGCKKSCYSDDDCISPASYCKKFTGNTLSRCECKSGYHGDGVICNKNPCGNDRHEKCGPDKNKVCVPKGSGPNDFECICPDGQFLDYTNKCAKEVTILKDTVLTLTGTNVQDGSRVEAGECLAFTLNGNKKTIFYHKNSGDSIFVRMPIKNEGSFTLFYVLTDEVTVFSEVSGTPFGLTKLYSMSNTFKECKFGHVKIFRPNGEEVLVGENTTEKVQVNVRTLSPEELVGGLANNVKLPVKVLEGDPRKVEVRPVSSLELEGDTHKEL